MSRAKALIDLLERSTFIDVINAEIMHEGDDDDKITNRRRGGTWMDPHHVKAAAENPKRTAAFYKKARNATDAKDQEYWLARVFNDDKVAKHIASSYYQKEANSSTYSVADVEDLSQSLIKGYSSRSTHNKQGSAASTERDDVDDLSVGGARGGDKPTTASFKVLSIKDSKRSPEEIAMSNQIVQLIYDAIDKEWPGRPQNKMVFTYLLARWNVTHLIKYDLPFAKRVDQIIDQCEKDGRSWMTANWFQFYSKIEQKMYDKVVKFISKTALELGGK